jgi:hypothetical protein
MKTKTYRYNRFAEVEGNNTTGWNVYNLVTGLSVGWYPTFEAARDQAQFLYLYYGAIERGH